MKFSEFIYERPDIGESIRSISKLAKDIADARSSEEAVKAVESVNRIRNRIETMSVLVEIRLSIDTTNSFYEGEREFLDENLPLLEPAIRNYYSALLESGFRKALETVYGQQLFELADISVRSFDEKLIPLMVEENKLCTEFQKLEASAAVPFEGETLNLSGLLKQMESSDRNKRKKAYHAFASFYSDHECDFDRIYDKMVRNRDQQAKLLGFENFIPLGYLRMARQGYDASDVAKFRQQVADDLVPVCSRILDRQRKRIGVDKLKFYDEDYQFTDGNAVPAGDCAYLTDCAAAMYRELSAETGSFFEMMRERELLDLDSKPGKAFGGYCTAIPDYKVPFIFSNFNGTGADVEVLTHESGHGFQSYMTTLSTDVPEYQFSTSEAAEIHSMSMEYFTYPWMERFFGDQADKYRMSHVADALTFVPYGVCVDEFQHRIYEQPEMTPEQRKAVWREVERKYLPDRDYDGEEIFEKGGFYFRKQHIFLYPFYYIDYTFASMAAFEFFRRMNENREEAWKDYLLLCKLGGTKKYLDLLKTVHLHSPFENGSVKNAILPMVEYLDSMSR